MHIRCYLLYSNSAKKKKTVYCWWKKNSKTYNLNVAPCVLWFLYNGICFYSYVYIYLDSHPKLNSYPAELGS